MGCVIIYDEQCATRTDTAYSSAQSDNDDKVKRLFAGRGAIYPEAVSSDSRKKASPRVDLMVT